jgi:hypothetical protein
LTYSPALSRGEGVAAAVLVVERHQPPLQQAPEHLARLRHVTPVHPFQVAGERDRRGGRSTPATSSSARNAVSTYFS